MKDLMIDIETLDTANTAMIVSIGAIEFDIKTGETGKEFYEVIDINSYKKLLNNPFTYNLDTLLWWLNQSKESQKIFDFKAENKRGIIDMMQSFKASFDFSKVRIWSKGNFDIPILEHALRACGLPVPWKYYQVMDMRTVLKLSELEFKKTNTHNALDDCKNQTNQLVMSLKEIKL